jgi:hypothetical protein
LLLSGATNNKLLFVLGHYEIPCGGGDTVSNRDEAFAMLREARDAGADILFEGLVYSDEVRRTVELYRDHSGAVVLLDTPVETCIERIKERRATAGNAKPLNEETTRQRVASIERACERLEQQNITVRRLAADRAYLFIRQKLGLGT